MAKFDTKAALKDIEKESAKLYHSFKKDSKTAFLLVPFNERTLFIKYEQFQDPEEELVTFGRSILSMGPKSYFAKNGITKQLGYPDGMTVCPVKEFLDKLGIKKENDKKEKVAVRPSPAWHCMIVPVAQISNDKGSSWIECESTPLVKGLAVKKGQKTAPQLFIQIKEAMKQGTDDFIVTNGDDLEGAKCLIVNRIGDGRETKYTLSGYNMNEPDSKIKTEEIDLSEFLDVDDLEEALETAAEDLLLEEVHSNLLLSYAELETLAEQASAKLGKPVDLECFRLKRSSALSSAESVQSDSSDSAEEIEQADPNELSDDSPF